MNADFPADCSQSAATEPQVATSLSDLEGYHIDFTSLMR